MNIAAPDVLEVAEKAGIGFWMERVLKECDRTLSSLAADPVHDLRVALRRCRSIAAGFMHFDPDRDWADMRKEATRLFRKLGELRDIQVMTRWASDPSAPADNASAAVLTYLSARETELKEAGAEALDRFDRKKWSAWSDHLSKRAARIPFAGLSFSHLALETWSDAHSLHRQALRNRTHVGFHRLRIGLKKFRYITENFLPGLHDEWGRDLKELHDLLGDMHDLHVLLQTAISIRALGDKDIRGRWRSWIDGEIRERLALYRRKMTGGGSLWHTWRAFLPAGEQLASAALERLQTWASFRDPDFGRSKLVAHLALKIHDGMESLGLPRIKTGDRSRGILRVSGLLHAVGRSRRAREIHKESYRLVRKLKPPLGWTADDFRMVALVIRYHRGALPSPGRKQLRGLPAEQLRLLALLSGALRLAVSLVGS